VVILLPLAAGLCWPAMRGFAAGHLLPSNVSPYGSADLTRWLAPPEVIMSKVRPPDEAELLRSIEHVSAEFHQLAGWVSDYVKKFNAWLNDLPGKTPVEIFQDHPDEPIGRVFGLCIDRVKNGGWGLFYVEGTREGESIQYDQSLWDGLDKAPLATKCIALSLLPELLRRMHQEHAQLVERLKRAKAVLDQLPNATVSAKEGA